MCPGGWCVALVCLDQQGWAAAKGSRYFKPQAVNLHWAPKQRIQNPMVQLNI